MVEIKGAVVNGSIHAIKVRNGEEAYNTIISRLDEQTKQLFENPISDADWYPLDLFLKFLEKDIELTANGDENELEKRSGALNEKYIKEVFGSFVRYEPPEFFIRHHSILHHAYFRGVSMKMKFDEPNKAVITYIGFEKQHRLVAPTIIGYYKKVLEVSETKDVNAKYLVPIEEDKGFCELEITWTTK